MDRKLLDSILSSRDELTAEEDHFSVGEGAHVSLLLKSGGGSHVPLPRVRRVVLAEGFITVTVEGADLCLPYGALLGVKVEDPAGSAPPKRTGFHS